MFRLSLHNSVRRVVKPVGTDWRPSTHGPTGHVGDWSVLTVGNELFWNVHIPIKIGVSNGRCEVTTGSPAVLQFHLIDH